MPIKIRIPTPLRAFTAGQDTAEVAGNTVGEVLTALINRYQGMDKRLFKQPGELNRFVNVYLNDEDIRFLDNLNTPIKESDTLSIVPAIAGG